MGKFNIGDFAWLSDNRWIYITGKRTSIQKDINNGGSINEEIVYSSQFIGNTKNPSQPFIIGDIKEYKAEELFTYDEICNKKENTVKTFRKDEVDQVFDMVNLSKVNFNGKSHEMGETTANCYVIKKCGRYCLPLVYGNALVNGEANPKAYTRKGKEENTQPFYDAYNKEITQPWIEGCVSGEVVGNDSPEDYVIDNIKVMEDGRYMEFEVTKFPELGGNAILAVKDKEGNVLWSWHLWAYADEIVDINGFMNVNLGWKWYDSEKKSGYNPHYQWGRKDPMLENCNICNAATNSFGEAIQKPGTFFCYESGNYNWVTVDGKSVNYYNYWNADCDGEDLMDLEVVKTVYDPCPVGFSIPKGDAFKGFNEDDGGEWEGGFTWNRRYFPAAGSRGRTSGSIYYVGSGGYYWSSAAYSRTYAYYLYFYSTYVNPRNASSRASGFSVVGVMEGKK